MRLLKFAPLLLLHLALSTMAHARSTPQRLWTLPPNTRYEGLLERPGTRLAVYWTHNRKLPGRRYSRYLIMGADGNAVERGEVPGPLYAGTGVGREDWNALGQHAYIPYKDATVANFIRLKIGESYRVLRIMPRFLPGSLQDLRFSPDGECLYVLSPQKLWIIGAQSGRLLRTLSPRGRRLWSDENATLSRDCRSILAMGNRMTLYSTRTAKVQRRFGVKVKTIIGSCGSVDASVRYVGGGRYAIACCADEVWVYPAEGGALCWHGRLPSPLRETAGGQFFVDAPDTGKPSGVAAMLRRWRDGKAGPRLKLNFESQDQRFSQRLTFSRDGRWIYFMRNRSLWRVAMPKLS